MSAETFTTLPGDRTEGRSHLVLTFYEDCPLYLHPFIILTECSRFFSQSVIRSDVTICASRYQVPKYARVISERSSSSWNHLQDALK